MRRHHDNGRVAIGLVIRELGAATRAVAEADFTVNAGLDAMLHSRGSFAAVNERQHGVLDSSSLEDLVQRFRNEGYPDEHTEQYREARAEFEGVLRSLPNLSYEQRGDLRFAWNQASNGYDYGGVGNTLPIDRAVLDVTEEDWPRMRDRIHELCFGEGDLAARFDEAVRTINDLGPVKAARFVAIAQPERFMPSFWTRERGRGRPGKIDVIEVLLRLDLLDATVTDTARELVESPRSADWKGDLAVRSNDLLMEVLHPWFTENDGVDTFGMVQFLNWLAERNVVGDGDMDDDDEPDESDNSRERRAGALADAAAELLCGVGFLNDIVGLLEDKRQVILYGPPGTGKTYFAQRLAHALAGNGSAAGKNDMDWMQRLDVYCAHLEQDQKVQSGTHRSIARRWIEFALERGLDPSAWDESHYSQFADLNPDWQDKTRDTHRYDLRRWCGWASGSDGSSENSAVSLVQFHPAYSYEDFFEGFRPAVDDGGNMTYRLTPGPLVRMADRARENPGQQHVMVIDEINRANLPRVLGELLFLLEYRDRAIHTQYRTEKQFSLPENLWFIGTMNTADRSIALIDAAMRRRFHFVPFFPDREPTAGLLRRWCEQNEPEQTWIADLLDGVNERLRGDLGGDHMLIGPSHFMKKDLDRDGLRRIWEYNIEPLIEDQFFGRREVIDSYRFDEVWKRHDLGATVPDSESGAPGDPGEDAETGSTHDDGDESSGDE